MERPDFKQMKKMEAILRRYADVMNSMTADGERQTEAVRSLAMEAASKMALESLDMISAEELRKSRAGIRVSALMDAGYKTLEDIYRADDKDLAAIEGIGEGQIASIRRLTAEFVRNMAAWMPVRIDPSDEEGGNLPLMQAAALLRRCGAVRRDAGEAPETFLTFEKDVLSRIRIRNSIRWLFSGREKKESTLEACLEMRDYLVSPAFARIRNLADIYTEARSLTMEDAARDFSSDSADFYAVIEECSQVRGAGARVYGSVPEKLAAEIDASPLDLSGFKGTLRAYQAFGARYILHQKKVLLGDEMGLGKTVQAIAAMCHIRSVEKGERFLVVAPASVLANWCREIEKFSNIPVYLLHGPGTMRVFDAWEAEGGAAVTNYESMGKIADRINDRMKLSLLVIDEAHYIKNPDARRSAAVRMLEDESDRILLMTGTPVENRVEEMCSLIGFIRPDMAGRVRELAYMKQIPQFREFLSPVYLRRQRDHVLKELPPVEEKQEWCMMSMTDLAWYTASVMSKNFTDMRRVSFHQEDLSTSSKAVRILEICREAASDERKVVIYSYFRETIRKISALLGEECAVVITGSTEVDKRQVILDDFAKGNRHVLVCQIQSGGTGLNIQAASLVIICEPQIKPSLTRQAVARVHRMGQIRGVLVFHMLCQDSIDEAMVRLLEEKQREFDLYADESALSLAEDSLYDSSWIRDFIEKEAARYLPGAGEMGESLLIGGPGEEEVRPDPEKTGPGDLPLIPSQAESPKMLTSEAEIYPPGDYNNDSRD